MNTAVGVQQVHYIRIPYYGNVWMIRSLALILPIKLGAVNKYQINGVYFNFIEKCTSNIRQN